jgi:hypothetical protein
MAAPQESSLPIEEGGTDRNTAFRKPLPRFFKRDALHRLIIEVG